MDNRRLRYMTSVMGGYIPPRYAIPDWISGAGLSNIQNKVITQTLPTLGRAQLLLIQATGVGRTVNSVVQTGMTWSFVARRTTNLTLEIWKGRCTSAPGTTLTINTSAANWIGAYSVQYDATDFTAVGPGAGASAPNLIGNINFPYTPVGVGNTLFGAYGQQNGSGPAGFNSFDEIPETAVPNGGAFGLGGCTADTPNPIITLTCRVTGGFAANTGNEVMVQEFQPVFA